MPHASLKPIAMRFARGIKPLALVLGCLCATVVGPVQAERADRSKPINIDADRSTVDLKRRIFSYSGNVVISQGSLNIRAERVEVRETANGRRVAVAQGTDGKATTFRQKGDTRDEVFEGSADRIEYDDQSDVVRFVGNASARRLLGAVVTGDMSGAIISYDNVNQIFSLEGQSPAGVRGSGRARAVFAPSAPASTPSSSPAASK